MIDADSSNYQSPSGMVLHNDDKRLLLIVLLLNPHALKTISNILTFSRLVSMSFELIFTSTILTRSYYLVQNVSFEQEENDFQKNCN